MLETKFLPQEYLQSDSNIETNSLAYILSAKRPNAFNEQSTSSQSNSQMKRLSTSKPLKQSTNFIDEDKPDMALPDVSQLELIYKEKLNEKDRLITELKAELFQCKKQLEKKHCNNKPLSIFDSHKEKAKDNKTNETFTERLSNFYTVKANNLLRSSIGFTQNKDQGLFSPKNQLNKSAKKTFFFKTPQKNKYSNISDTFRIPNNSNKSQSQLVNNKENALSVLDQLKDKTRMVLNKYSEIAQSLSNNL